MSSAWKAHEADPMASSAPVTATWPSQTRKMVRNPRVSWVTSVIAHAATKNALLHHTRRNASRTLRTPLDV